MRLKESEAIVLRSFKLAEADKVIVFLTRTQGTVRGVTKGARRLKSRFGASLEPFTLTQLTYFEKEGRELVQVRQSEIIRSYFNLARKEDAVAALEYLGELVLEFAPPHQPDEKLFRMVKAVVAALDAAPEKLQALVRYFEIWILKLSGFMPDPRVCGVCGKALGTAGEGKVFLDADFSPRCERCSVKGAQELPPDTQTLLRTALSTPPETWAASAEAARPQARELLARLTRTLIERHLERRPRGASALTPAQNPLQGR
jgi:DNA repair protein RecO (recombination protein O)